MIFFSSALFAETYAHITESHWFLPAFRFFLFDGCAIIFNPAFFFVSLPLTSRS